jgi:DNA-binding transcriptional LysR family regulator
MDIRDLVYFEAIARLGHLGRAAMEVGRTKPALSKCIRRLEEHVKAPLFERRGRRLALTEPGRTLLEHARRMRVSMADALRHTAEQAAGERGHIRIGLGTSIVEAMLPALAGWYREESNGISLAVQVGLNDALRRELADDQLDGIITTALREDESQFERQDWVEDDVVVVARAGHALDQRSVRRNWSRRSSRKPICSASFRDAACDKVGWALGWSNFAASTRPCGEPFACSAEREGMCPQL